jgi:hypothetical protein
MDCFRQIKERVESCIACTAFTCIVLLIVWAVLFFVGISMISDPYSRPRGIEKYNTLVDEWHNDIYPTLSQVKNITATSRHVDFIYTDSFEVIVNDKVLNDDDKEIKIQKQHSFRNSNFRFTSPNQFDLNRNIEFEVHGFPKFEVPAYKQESKNYGTSPDDEKRCIKDKGEYRNGTCVFKLQVESICVLIDIKNNKLGNVADAEHPGCFKQIEGPYRGKYFPATYTIFDPFRTYIEGSFRVYEQKDPYIWLYDYTHGSLNFGMTPIKKMGTGLLLIGISLLPCLCCCIASVFVIFLIITLTRKRREGYTYV